MVLASASSSASKVCPRPRPWPRRFVLGLGLENLSSFNITGTNYGIAQNYKDRFWWHRKYSRPQIFKMKWDTPSPYLNPILSPLHWKSREKFWCFWLAKLFGGGTPKFLTKFYNNDYIDRANAQPTTVRKRIFTGHVRTVTPVRYCLDLISITLSSQTKVLSKLDLTHCLWIGPYPVGIQVHRLCVDSCLAQWQARAQ